MPERISEFGAVAGAARDAHPARRPHEVRILLLDRRTLLGECLAGALTAEWPALEVETATVNEIGRYREGGFDLCLVLVASDGAAGARLTSELNLLAEVLPEVPTVVLSEVDHPSLVATAARHGARGFFSTSARLCLLVQGIRLVLLGGTALPSTIPVETTWATVEQASANDRPLWPELQPLTPREAEVLRALAAGKPNKLIAHELAVCETTIKVHLRHIFRKLGCSNRTHAALVAREMIEGVAAAFLENRANSSREAITTEQPSPRVLGQHR